jgi:hypothetical protein
MISMTFSGLSLKKKYKERNFVSKDSLLLAAVAILLRRT